MTEWKQYLRKNRGFLLTLPAAALWSLPIGLFARDWLRQYFPEFVSIDPLGDWTNPVLYLLVPLSAVCSTIAVLVFIDNRHNVHPFIVVIFWIFNLGTAFVALSATMIAIIGFWGGSLQEIFR